MDRSTWQFRLVPMTVWQIRHLPLNTTVRPHPRAPMHLRTTRHATRAAQVAPWGAAATPIIAILAVILAGTVAGACGSSAATEGHAGGRPRSTIATTGSDGSDSSVTSEAESAAASGATATFQRDISTASTAFVSDVGRLQVAVDAGAVAAARVDELAAQASYDSFRLLENANEANATSLDELVTDVGSGQSFGGLHAVERDLWSSGDAADDISGLVAQAPVAEYLLSKDRLGAEAIGTTGVDELGWVNEMAIPGREELYSHLDDVDIAATVGAAHDAYVSVAPLGRLVAPSLTITVGEQFTRLLAEVDSLGPPAQVPDSAISNATRLSLSQQVDATAAELARLSATLAPFGTSGVSS
jgi:iron uptake system EfeUOB component EfeO/EfeM